MRFALWMFLLAAPDAPPVTVLAGADFVRAIRAAPEEPGNPGLYAVNLASPSDPPVLGIRRTGTGRSEVHAKFTDVWYVIQGSATLVTGGSVAGGAEIQPGETRGASLTGGEARRISAGDVAVVPPGVPHWISAVEGKEFLYLVVKVPARP